MINLNPTEPKEYEFTEVPCREHEDCTRTKTKIKSTPTTPKPIEHNTIAMSPITAPFTGKPDWKKEFEYKFPFLGNSGYESKCSNVTDEVKSFISQVSSESYERGKEEGIEQYTEQLIAEVEGMERVNAAPQEYNQALYEVLKILKEGYKKGLEELNK